MHSLARGVTCSLTHPLTHSLTQSCTHSLHTHSLTHSPTHALTHSPAYSPTQSLTHPPTHSLIHSPVHSFTHSLTHALTKSFTHSMIYLLALWVITPSDFLLEDQSLLYVRIIFGRFGQFFLGWPLIWKLDTEKIIFLYFCQGDKLILRTFVWV